MSWVVGIRQPVFADNIFEMFKIESYVTPLILSYVNKYVKNIKPEDSQVGFP